MITRQLLKSNDVNTTYTLNTTLYKGDYYGIHITI